MQEYAPANYSNMSGAGMFPSAWRGLERIIPDILDRFQVGRERALEFGCEFGYSTSILAQLFKQVTGVCLFVECGALPSAADAGRSDVIQSKYGLRFDTKHRAEENLAAFKNVTLIQGDWEVYAAEHENEHWDLLHLDTSHAYDDTYKAAKWALSHADISVYHDTESDPETKQALQDIERDNQEWFFYNYQPCYGLGILARNK